MGDKFTAKNYTPKKKKDKMHSKVGGEEIAASPLLLQRCGGMFLHCLYPSSVFSHHHLSVWGLSKFHRSLQVRNFSYLF